MGVDLYILIGKLLTHFVIYHVNIINVVRCFVHVKRCDGTFAFVIVHLHSLVLSLRDLSSCCVRVVPRRQPHRRSGL